MKLLFGHKLTIVPEQTHQIPFSFEYSAGCRGNNKEMDAESEQKLSSPLELCFRGAVTKHLTGTCVCHFQTK